MCVCMDNSAYGKYWNCTRYPNSHDSFLDNFPIAQKYKSDLLIILLTNYDTSWKLQLYLPSFHVSKLVYVLKVTPPISSFPTQKCMITETAVSHVSLCKQFNNLVIEGFLTHDKSKTDPTPEENSFFTIWWWLVSLNGSQGMWYICHTLCT